MIIFDSPEMLSQYHENCVATIGKFDGVHLGHQLILDQLKQKAEQQHLPAVVILLEPHPEEFFAKDINHCPARLTSIKEKLELLESFGVDFVFQLEFNKELSTLSAEDYVKNILVDGLGITCLIVGHDFKFGHQRQGDFKLLQNLGAEFNFEVLETAAYERNGQRISSTFIREKLGESDFKLVEQLLGRPYSMKGEVQRGQQLGTDLGYPTCNINPHRRKIPLQGVFACRVRLVDQYFQAAVNIGYRPTVTDNGEALLEAHILDFAEELYGRTIEVIFLQKLREEEKFDGLEELKEQIGKDVELAREVLSASA